MLHTSESRFNTWLDMISDKDGFDRLNRNSDTVLAKTSYNIIKSAAPVLDLLKGDPQIVLLTVIPVEGARTFFRKVLEILGGIGSSFATLVGLEE